MLKIMLLIEGYERLWREEKTEGCAVGGSRGCGQTVVPGN
jgi:hypothetical protein